MPSSAANVGDHFARRRVAAVGIFFEQAQHDAFDRRGHGRIDRAQRRRRFVDVREDHRDEIVGLVLERHACR